MDDGSVVERAGSIRIRTWIQWALIGALGVVFVLFGGLVGASYVISSDEYYAYYDDREEAASAGAVDDGWVPIYLPVEMIEIHERHDWDHCVAVLRFVLPPTVMQSFSASGVESMGFDPMPAIDGALVSRAEAWLEAASNAPGLNDPGYRFYGGKQVQASGPTFLAVHAESGVVYHWIR